MLWLIVIGIVLILLFIVFFNQIISEDNQVKNAFATVDVYLKKRYDLIPNLVEIVKGHAAHEKEVFETIAGVRAKALDAKTSDETVQMDGKVNSALKSLLMVAEQYPELKTNASYLELQKSLLLLEDELAAARRTYNSAVTEYNTTVESFPTNAIAGIMGRRQKTLFNVTDEVRSAIKINI